MPGKVNPTQVEALTMVCAQVIGNDTTIAVAGMQGHLQLNVFKPVISANFLQSAELIADACKSFEKNCILGIQPNLNNIGKNLKNSLMLVTALNTKIGYDKASEIAKNAYNNGTTLKEEALKLKYLSEEEFDKWVNPILMCNK
jgi:fumarate hydratase class II